MRDRAIPRADVIAKRLDAGAGAWQTEDDRMKFETFFRAYDQAAINAYQNFKNYSDYNSKSLRQARAFRKRLIKTHTDLYARWVDAEVRAMANYGAVARLRAENAELNETLKKYELHNVGLLRENMDLRARLYDQGQHPGFPQPPAGSDPDEPGTG